jgi:hypothetical protein
MEAISASHASIARKIKALHEAGFSRSAIAGFLRKGYQHVRNVLVQETGDKARDTLLAHRPAPSGVQESGPTPWVAADEEPASCGVFDVDDEGRIHLPPALLRVLDALPSRRVPWRLENGELVLMSLDAASRQIDRLMAEIKPRPGGLVDDLIAERRAEFEREERKLSARAAKHE